MMSREFRDILGGQFIAVTGGALAGGLLTLATDKLTLVPGLFILLPGFLAMRGNIAGTMAARLANALHLGSFSPATRRPRIVRDNYLASTVLGLTTALVLGIIAWLATRAFFGVSHPSIILVALIAAILSNLIMLPLAKAATVWLYQRGHDPNNVMGPYITTVGDLVSIAALLIAIHIV